MSRAIIIYTGYAILFETAQVRKEAVFWLLDHALTIQGRIRKIVSEPP